MKKILIIIDTSRASGRKFLTGAERFIAAFARWEVIVKPPGYLMKSHIQTDSWFNMDNIDGMLVRDAINIDPILGINKPKVINDTLVEYVPDASTIVTNSHDIGRLAADHFLDLGYKNFAYCGFTGLPWSQKRYEGFAQTLKSKGIDNCYNYVNDNASQAHADSDRLKMSQWLAKIPRPLCVFACNDDRAVTVLEACKIAKLNVPEEIAVLGVDNDELMCNLSSPSLSSIELDFENAGFKAAQHLNDLIQVDVDTRIIAVPPLEIVSRQSTDVFAIEDEEVVGALIYIRDSFQKPIQITDVVKATCLSRRELERRFKKYLNKTIKSEIEGLRINLIKKRILNSNEPFYHIARDLEFTDMEHFSRYFKNITGQSPTQFRLSHTKIGPNTKASR